MVATGISILATFASFAGISSDSNASYEVENEVMDDETSDNQDNESFETSDKISGDIEIGDFDLPEEPEITVEDNTETVIIEEKDEVVDIFTETDTDIEVEVDVDRKPFRKPMTTPSSFMMTWKFRKKSLLLRHPTKLSEKSRLETLTFLKLLRSLKWFLQPR